MLKDYHLAIAKIYFVAGLSILLLTFSFYLFGFKPLSDRLHSQHRAEIQYFLDSNLLLFQGEINRHFELSRQIASRTAIRKKQAAYLHGEVSIDELVNFSVPKLTDALKANREVIGINRYDPTGKFLFAVGQELPGELEGLCTNAPIKAIRALNPAVIDDQRRLVYCSPVVDDKDVLVGIDIVILKQDGIMNIINSPHGKGGTISIISVTSNENIIYWPESALTLPIRGVFNDFLNTGISNVSNDYIIQSHDINNTDWQLYAITNSKLFFAEIDQQLMLLLSVLIVIAMILLALTVIALRPIIRSLLQQKQLFDLSHTDGLTGLFNHAYMEELLDQELSQANRYHRPLSIMMFDIDHFKAVNDTYGHLAGDDVLSNIAAALLEGSREQDKAARYGGEEFLLILRETGEQGAITRAERLRSKIAALHTKTDAGEINVTISIGVVIYQADAGKLKKRDLIQAADKAMYTSKEAGRNRVTSVCFPEQYATGPVLNL